MYLAGLFEHPVKSMRGNAVTSATVRSEGLAHDRRFLVHTPDGTFISGRSHPKLVTVVVAFDGETLTLTAGSPSASEPLPPLVLKAHTGRLSMVAVWKDRFDAWDQGDEAARWLSNFLGEPVRLAWLGDSQRPLRWDNDRRVTFADAAPLLVVSQASLDDLSRRVGEALSMRRFRPNLVLGGAEPFEEDTWRRLRIGEVEFLNLDGCSRCEFTTLDPETGERHPAGEPVKTLEAYRRVDTGIYFGMNVMPLSLGTVRVGDSVTVLERRVPLSFVPSSLAAWSPVPNGTLLPASPFLEDAEAELVCLKVRDEAPGVKTFTLARQDGMELAWKAGQYLTLRLPGELRRSYSISSAPGGALEITVKRLPDGRASGWLHDNLVPGGAAVCEGIRGHFTLEDHPWNTLLLMGAGSGVTPLMAILRSLSPRPVAFHQTVRNREDLLFADELERLRGQWRGNLTVSHRVTSEEGHLDHNGLVRFCPDLRDRRVFVCGPPGYRASVRGLLAGAGVKIDRRYHEEVYGEAALEVPQDAVPGQVTFALTGKTVASDGRTTVLQLAERVGLTLPFSCRSGDCGTCRVQTEAGEWQLACHTFARGDACYNL
ncbi:MAG: MOSC N-terminal beta barrel domain-containing protein [Spirochaetales bacterium]